MKVAIVGGGICGLYLAYQLGEKEDVFLFEKREGIGKKACSSLVSERIFHFIPQSQKIIKHKIKGVCIYFPSREIFVNFKKDFFVFERKDLENLLLSLAQKRAKIYFSKEIKEIPEGFQRIIFADGAFSFSQKFLLKNHAKIYFGIQGFEEKEDYSQITEVFPTKNGFIWKIPRGQDREWGIVEKKEDAFKIFDLFLKKRNIKIKNKKSSLISQGFLFPKKKEERWAIVGEARGLVKPWSFGGIIWGLTACEILKKIFPHFLNYEKELRKTFIFQVLFSQFLKKIVYFTGFNFPFLFFLKNYEIDGDFFDFSVFLNPFLNKLNFFDKLNRFFLKKQQDFFIKK